MEDTIERIVGYFRYAAQGLEERKQILYLLGPVGGGKSSLAERLKQLMEKQPIYVLKARRRDQPGLRDCRSACSIRERMADLLEDKYGIARRRLTGLISPWATKRLDQIGGDISKFSVVKLMPSRLRQIGIAKTEPGDENNQDVSSLVGKVDIRQLEHFSQHDPDAYSYSGGLNRTTQGLLEFVEMFKAPIKVLHPLLTATQEGNYNGTENFGAFPYQGIVAGALQRVGVAAVQEQQEQRGLPRPHPGGQGAVLPARDRGEADLREAAAGKRAGRGVPARRRCCRSSAASPCSTRLHEHENSPLYTKMRVYDGENLKDTDPKAKIGAGIPRHRRRRRRHDRRQHAFRLQGAVRDLQLRQRGSRRRPRTPDVHARAGDQARAVPGRDREAYLDFIKSELAPRYAEFIGHEIQKAYLESYSEYGQNLFDRYIAYADAWIEDQDFKDPDTGQIFNRKSSTANCRKIEKPAGIANPKDFRNEVVKFTLRARARNDGRNPAWTSYEKLREVIEKRMFGQVEDLLPVISFGTKKDTETEKQHQEFVQRMVNAAIPSARCGGWSSGTCG